jgi:hypothetical protein
MDNQSASRKPRCVGIATNLLWASLFIGLVKSPMDEAFMSTTASLGAKFVSLAIVFGVVGFLVWKISARRNWARITFLVITVIGLVPWVPFLLNELSRSPVLGGLSVAIVGLQAWAIFLLFSPSGNRWFRKAATV